MAFSRRDIRILVIQVLFENDFNQRAPDPVAFMRTFNYLVSTENSELIDNAFARKLLEGIASKYDEINAIIEQAAPKWPLDKIGSLDRNILRLGVFELLFGKDSDVPGRVALNEAIEITKLFLNDNARKFINGVLGAVYIEVKDPNEVVPPPKRQTHKKLVGGVVFRITDEGVPEFMFVHDIFGYWTLSKSGLEKGESLEEGFIRTVREEVNIKVEVLEKIGSNSYAAHPPEGIICKEVSYLLGKTNETELRLKDSEGLDDAKWFTYDEAKKLSFYPDIKQIIFNGLEKAVQQCTKISV